MCDPIFKATEDLLLTNPETLSEAIRVCVEVKCDCDKVICDRTSLMYKVMSCPLYAAALFDLFKAHRFYVLRDRIVMHEGSSAEALKYIFDSVNKDSHYLSDVLPKLVMHKNMPLSILDKILNWHDYNPQPEKYDGFYNSLSNVMYKAKKLLIQNRLDLFSGEQLLSAVNIHNNYVLLQHKNVNTKVIMKVLINCHSDDFMDSVNFVLNKSALDAEVISYILKDDDVRDSISILSKIYKHPSAGSEHKRAIQTILNMHFKRIDA